MRRWLIFITGLPTHDIEVPRSVLRLASSQSLTLVWQNELGGLTFEMGEGRQRVFVKWAPMGSGLDLLAEAARMSWAAPYTPVPKILDQGADEEGAWLVTTPLPGASAISERWSADPAIAVTAIGEGLRALHEALPVTSARSRGQRKNDWKKRNVAPTGDGSGRPPGIRATRH